MSTPLESKHPNYEATATLGAQRAAIAQQDESLQEMEAGVATVKKVAGLLHDEVEEQNQLLDGIDTDLQRTQRRTERTLGRTGNALAQGDIYNLRTFCMLLWPLVLLIVLLIEAVIHFLFR